MEHVERTLAVAEPGDSRAVDRGVSDQDTDSRDELLKVRAHAELAEQNSGVLGRVRARGPLVVAERREAGLRKRLGKESAATVGAG